MNSGFDHRPVRFGDNPQSLLVLAGNDFRDRFKAMLPVSGIDALGRITDGEI
jgi:hypothetical protein